MSAAPTPECDERETPGLAFFGYFLLWMCAAGLVGLGWLVIVQATTPAPSEATSSGGDSEVATALAGLALVFMAIPAALVGLAAAALGASLRPRGWVFFVASLLSLLAVGAAMALVG